MNRNYKTVFYYVLIILSIEFFLLLTVSWAFLETNLQTFHFLKNKNDRQITSIISNLKRNISRISLKGYQQAINSRIKYINYIQKNDLKILGILVYSTDKLIYNSKLSDEFYISSIKERKILKHTKQLIYDDISKPIPYKTVQNFSRGRMWQYSSYFFPEVRYHSLFQSIKIAHKKKMYSIHIIYQRKGLIPFISQKISDYKLIALIVFSLGLLFSIFILFVSVFFLSGNRKKENQNLKPKENYGPQLSPKPKNNNKVLDGIYLG